MPLGLVALVWISAPGIAKCQDIINLPITLAGKRMITPSVSRPPPPIVDPVEHDGIRYIQDDHDSRAGDQNGGYLAAIDIKSGARLWRLTVYKVSDNRPAGLPSFGRYFRFMPSQRMVLPWKLKMKLEDCTESIW